MTNETTDVKVVRIPTKEERDRDRAYFIARDYINALDLVEAERDALARFKHFVHAYLDQHGVPHGDPNNQHQKEGCRIGARLDLLFALSKVGNEQRDMLIEQLEVARQLEASFWQALKPLNLQQINVQNPGQHVSDVIGERDALRAQIASLKASPAGEGILEEIEKLRKRHAEWQKPTRGKITASAMEAYEIATACTLLLFSDRLRLALSREGGSEGHPLESPELIHDFNITTEGCPTTEAGKDGPTDFNLQLQDEENHAEEINNLGALWTLIANIKEPIRKCFIDRTMPFAAFYGIAVKWHESVAGEGHPDHLAKRLKDAEGLLIVQLAKEISLGKALMLACKRIADGPQEYHEANTAEGWRDTFLKQAALASPSSSAGDGGKV